MTDHNTKLPWQDNTAVEMETAVSRLVSALEGRKAETNPPKIPNETKSLIQRQFKNAEQARSNAGKFMRAIAVALGHEDPGSSYVIADMKNLNRIHEKFTKAARRANDIGRGRIYLDNVRDYHAFLKILRSKSRNGVINNAQTHGVAIINGSISDYLKSPRKSGYAGSINLDLDVDLKQGRHGTFEVQLMPREYESVDTVSHSLFDMIRILQEMPESYLTPEDKEIRDALILANQALYLEHGIRSGFIDIRVDKPVRITDQKLRTALTVLDKIWVCLTPKQGGKNTWVGETKAALTEAKTSLVNINIAQKTKTPRASRKKTPA